VVEKLSGLAGYKVFVVTNQAGVAEGLNTAEEAQSFVEQVNELCSGVITDYCICMEPAASGSEFRKPRPSMVIGLLAAHKLPPAAAVMVGDSENDRKCAAAANLAGFVWARDYFGWK
jgi:D-glycero-D-manno-heptose 1,7-bisphosphate phosphatase